MRDYQDQPGLICNIRLSGISGLELQEQLKQSKYSIIFMTDRNDANTAVQELKKRRLRFFIKTIGPELFTQYPSSSLRDGSEKTALEK